ncbi:DNA-binding domain-containing protein [Aromatoleum anaerobium]|uniref:DUF2063 domain-containing protein n=1 Tax=Aromatoleum anaerobium TaxID=182180 RepID=A0ABX1PK33_9RHOO|nr:DNA-binding domain-containing protein [Aromatoleum anaerobium]MCK0509438.1 DNA-binding domain-containing protein [Aromatoleum anaerobium]
MPSLPELQETFAAALLAPAPDGALPFVVADRIAPAERLAVYRHNVRHNFREALRAVYAVVDRLVGARFFDYAADRYTREHPSTSGDIHAFGARFADFLAAFAPAAGLPYLPDVARLEWAMHEVFHAAAPPPFPLERLAALPAAAHAALCFTPSPACRLLASRWPVHRLWALNQPGVAWDETFDLGAGGVTLLVRRSGFEVELEPLPGAEFALLDRLAGGQALAAALEAVGTSAPDFDLAAFLQRHLLTATLCDFSPG